MHSTQRLHPAARGSSPSSSTDEDVRSDAAENRRDRSGEVLAGRYRLLERIGMGGMGSVYRAVHTTIRKPVAVKILDGQYLGQPEFVSRFLREAQAASHLRHEHIVDVTDFGETADGTVFSVMEFLDGEDLAVTLDREQRLPWSRVKAITLQVLSALDCAHRNGIVHRDIKLENCFRIHHGKNSEFIKVLDFGNAKLIGASAGTEGCNFDPQARRAVTAMGVIVGTAAYISPEQAEQLPLDARSDLYSVGVMVFELLTGRLPFDAPTFMGVLSKHISEAPPSPRAVCPQANIAPQVEELVLRLLAKRPAQRFESAAALSQAIIEIPDSAPKTEVQVASDNSFRRGNLPLSTRRLDLSNLGLPKPAADAVRSDAVASKQTTHVRGPQLPALPPLATTVATPQAALPPASDSVADDSASQSRPGTRHVAVPAFAAPSHLAPKVGQDDSASTSASSNDSEPVQDLRASGPASAKVDRNQLAAAEAQWEDFVGHPEEDPQPGDSIVAAVALARPHRKLLRLLAPASAAILGVLAWQSLREPRVAISTDTAVVGSSLVEPRHDSSAAVIPPAEEDTQLAAEDGNRPIEEEDDAQLADYPAPSLMIQFTDDQKITGGVTTGKTRPARRRSATKAARSKSAESRDSDESTTDAAPAVAEFSLPASLTNSIRLCGRKFGGIPGDRISLVFAFAAAGSSPSIRVQGKRLSNDLESCVKSAVQAQTFTGVSGTHTKTVRL